MKNGVVKIESKRGGCTNCPPKKSQVRDHAVKGKINVSNRNEH
jgi:hypothetical protein